MNKSHEMNMTEGPMFLKLFLFALPVMASNILQVLFNAVDVIVVGKCVGDTALAAVGATGSTYNLFINIAMGLGVGTNVAIGKYYGAKRNQELSDTLHTSIFAALIGGLIVAAAGLFFARPLLKLLGTPDDVIDQSTLYLTIVLAGSVFTFLYNFAASVLRAVGDTRRPLYYLTIAGVSNVFFNLFFVLVCRIGVAGVALGTVISQAISAFLVIRTLMNETGSLHFSWKKMKLHKNCFLELLRIGLPAGLQGAVFSISNMTVTSSVNSFGKTVMAGSTACGNIESFIYTSMNAFYTANVSVTAQNYGARKTDRIKKSLLISGLYVTVIGLILGVLLLVFGEPLLRIYTDSAETVQAGLEKIQVIAVPYFLCGLMEVLCASLRGMGHSSISTVNSILGSCLFRIVWIFTVFRAYPSIGCLYIVYPVSWLITCILHIIRLTGIFRKK